MKIKLRCWLFSVISRANWQIKESVWELGRCALTFLLLWLCCSPFCTWIHRAEWKCPLLACLAAYCREMLLKNKGRKRLYRKTQSWVLLSRKHFDRGFFFVVIDSLDLVPLWNLSVLLKINLTLPFKLEICLHLYLKQRVLCALIWLEDLRILFVHFWDGKHLF